MKKFYSLALAVLLALPMFVSGQVYQLPNGGFELWDNNYSSTDDEPTNWNSFPSADCTVSFGCAAATATRHERSTDKRPGSTGQYSCKIWVSLRYPPTGTLPRGVFISAPLRLPMKRTTMCRSVPIMPSRSMRNRIPSSFGRNSHARMEANLLV